MSESGVRLYGGWRERRGIGVGKLDTRQTIAVMVVFGVAMVLVTIFGIAGLLVSLPFAAIALALVLYRHNGVVALDVITAWARYRVADSRGETRQVASVLQEWPISTDLPGVLGSTVLLDAEVPGMERAGVVWHQASGRLAITVLVDAMGTMLSDRGDAERAVAHWGNLLATLSDFPQIEAATVTLDLRPGAGGELRSDLVRRMRPDGPQLGFQVLEQLLEMGPSRSTRSERWLTIVFNPSRAPERLEGPYEAVAEALRTVNALDLSAAGAMVRGLASASDIKRIVRTSYDPELIHANVQPEEWEALRWGETGPDGAEELPDAYEHNGATSVSWALAAAPRQRVGHNVLVPLMRPGRYARRVTLMYRVSSREEAGRVLETEQTAAGVRREVRRRSHKDANARDIRDEQLAARAAAQEAAGASLVWFSAVVTTTVTDPDDLDAAKAEVVQAAGSSKTKLRLARHGQAAAFAVGLPCGIYPPEMAKAPRRRSGRTLGVPVHELPDQYDLDEVDDVGDSKGRLGEGRRYRRLLAAALGRNQAELDEQVDQGVTQATEDLASGHDASNSGSNTRSNTASGAAAAGRSGGETLMWTGEQR